MDQERRREREKQWIDAKSGNRHPNICIYCGLRAAVKKDHVVGRAFFDKLPAQVVTVPSCNECDAGKGDGGSLDFHLDEEYVRNMLCLKTNLGSNSSAYNLMPRVVRSIERSGAMIQATVATSHLVDVRTPEGIIIPDQWAFQAELDRIKRVIKKIVRGLYYTQTRSRLPDNVEFGIDIDPPRSRYDDYLAACTNSHWYGMGDVFMYKSARWVPDFQTMWLMIFYRSHAIMASTAMPSDVDTLLMKSGQR